MSAPRKKRKSDANVDLASAHHPICIIHYADCNSETINLLADLKDPSGRFQKIKVVCNKRLAEPLHSVTARGAIPAHGLLILHLQFHCYITIIQHSNTDLQGKSIHRFCSWDLHVV